MSHNIEIDIVLNTKKYSKIYNATTIIMIIIGLSLIIIFTYKYQTYYITKGKMVNNYLEVLVDTNDIKYFNNGVMIIDKKEYKYKLVKIKKEIMVDNLYNTYNYVYLKVDNVKNMDNYVYEIKIPKERKTLAKYLKDYL